MISSCRQIACLAVALAGLSGCTAWAGETAHEIMATLARRQAAVRCLRIKWTETRTFTKAGGIVDSDTTLQRTITVWLDGSKARCEYTGQTRNNDKVVDHAKVDVSNGEARKTYFKSHEAARGWGKSLPPGACDDFSANGFQPFLLSFRALEPICPIGLASNRKWDVSSLREKVNGEPCVVFKRAKGPKEELMALSVEKGYAPVQYAISYRGNRELQMDVTHRQDKVFGWVPKSWRFVQLAGNSGQIAAAVAAEVDELEINAKIDADTFSFEFPVDTIVYDSSTKANYLVLESGRHTRVDVDTEGNVFSEEPQQRGVGRWLLLAGSLPLALLCLFCWIWRRRRLSAAREHAKTSG